MNRQELDAALSRAGLQEYEIEGVREPPVPPDAFLYLRREAGRWVVGIYERGKISARVAYNWRSKFLLTTSGNGSGNLPVFEKAFGQLDASITYDVTPHFSLTLQGVNLTSTRTSTYYGIETRPRDSIINDRQLSGVARITF